VIDTVICGDALEVMRGMDDNSIDLIATDPPYFRVKGDWWDRQWDDAGKFIEWIGELCEQWERILKPNGSLYVFASPKMAARVEVEVGRRLNVLNVITWAKPEFSTKAEMNDKSTSRSFFPASERIIFAEHYGADNIAKGEAGYAAKCDELRGFVFEPLRKYLDDERRAAGISLSDIETATGWASTKVRHYFCSGKDWWRMPTEESWGALSGIMALRPYSEHRREYEYLRREYEDLRRPFSLTADVPYTDVWTFPTVNHYPGKHPCEKPLEMMRHIIRTSSREGGVVLDCFAGSGTTLLAARNLGRHYVGIDIEQKWCEFVRGRIAQPQQLVLT